jgi:hypothetical protein
MLPHTKLSKDSRIIRCFGIIAILLLPATSFGQEKSAQAVLYRASTQNWYVRVNEHGSDPVQGRVSRVEAMTALVGNRLIRMDSLETIERRFDRGSSKVPGAVGGAIIFGALAASWSDPDSGGTKGIIPVLGGAGFGAGIGMLIGELLDPGVIEWRRVWP